MASEPRPTEEPAPDTTQLDHLRSAHADYSDELFETKQLRILIPDHERCGEPFTVVREAPRVYTVSYAGEAFPDASWTVAPDQPLLIGHESPDTGECLRGNKFVSRRHAALRVTHSGDLRIEDHSTNGTGVEPQPLPVD